MAMAHLRGFGSLLKMTICHISGWHRYAILSGESIKGRQSVAAPLASDFCKSDHLHLSISHFLACQCCQTLSKKQPWQWPLRFKNKARRRHSKLAKHSNQDCKQGTHKSLLLSNWSSWHRAVSATQKLCRLSRTLGDSGTPSCSALDVAGLRHMLGSLHHLHGKGRPTGGTPPLKTAPDLCSRWVLRSYSCRWRRCWSRYGQEQQ